MAKIELKISGMHCSSCEMLICDGLSELDGINFCKADHKSGIVEVDYDEQKTSLNQIKSIIKKEGYEVE